jgi:hypothetical protein
VPAMDSSFLITEARLGRGGGAGRSHENVAPPPPWKSFWASCAALGMELLHLHPFGMAPGGAVVGAGAGALPKRPYLHPHV